MISIGAYPSICSPSMVAYGAYSELLPEPKQAEPEPEPEPKRVTPAPEVKPPTQEPVQPIQPAPAPAPAPAPVSQPPSISPPKTQTQQSPVTSALFQQNLPQQVQQPNQQVQTHPIPASISQPSISSQNPTPALSSPVVSFTPQSQAVSQPSLANHHQPQSSHIPQQSLNNGSAPSLYGQHELPSHLNPQTQVQPSPHAPQPQPSVASYTSHFRQQEAPYFHTPTPPASSQESPYGAFGQLGQTLQHQSQPSHTGFGADYGYNDRNVRKDALANSIGELTVLPEFLRLVHRSRWFQQLQEHSRPRRFEGTYWSSNNLRAPLFEPSILPATQPSK